MATTDDREISEKIDFYDVDTKEKGESFATQAEEENSPIPIVAATVSLDDDPTLPAVTVSMTNGSTPESITNLWSWFSVV